MRSTHETMSRAQRARLTSELGGTFVDLRADTAEAATRRARWRKRHDERKQLRNKQPSLPDPISSDELVSDDSDSS